MSTTSRAGPQPSESLDNVWSCCRFGVAFPRGASSKMAAHPEILVPLMVFGMPVAMVWISKHYRALERGHIKRKDELPEDKESSKRIASLEQDKQQLEARVENIATIVCSGDLALNARLHRLAILQSTPTQHEPDTHSS